MSAGKGEHVVKFTFLHTQLSSSLYYSLSTYIHFDLLNAASVTAKLRYGNAMRIAAGADGAPVPTVERHCRRETPETNRLRRYKISRRSGFVIRLRRDAPQK